MIFFQSPRSLIQFTWSQRVYFFFTSFYCSSWHQFRDTLPRFFTNFVNRSRTFQASFVNNVNQQTNFIISPIFFEEKFLLKSIITVDWFCFLEIHVLISLYALVRIDSMDSPQTITFQAHKKLIKLDEFGADEDFLLIAVLLNHIFSPVFDYN